MAPAELLKNVYLFHGATAKDLAALAAITERKSCLAGDIVYEAGADADAMFYIEMGTVEIVNPGTERVFAGYGTGQTVGEIAFFDGGKREAVARTREATRLLRVPFAGLRTLLGERPGSFSIKTRARSSRSICAN